MFKFEVKQIGVIRSNIYKHDYKHHKEAISEIILAPQYTEGLDGIEEFSHLYILYWMHDQPNGEEREVLKIHPGSMKEFPLVGVFSTRSPVRPNPIGLSLVKIMDKKGNTIMVKGLDAIDGTPVIDIKPYNPLKECQSKAKFPQWLIELIKKKEGE